LWQQKEAGLSRRDFFGRFYWRRALRIFPLYYAVLLLLGITYRLTGTPAGIGDHWLYLLTYTFNWRDVHSTALHIAPLWSLALEEQFYLVWPWLVLALPLRRFRVLVGTLIVALPLLRLAGFWTLADAQGTLAAADAAHFWTIFQIDAFAWGAAVAVFQPLLARYARPLLLGSLACFAAGGILNTVLGFPTGHLPSHLQPLILGYPISPFANGQAAWGYTLVNFLGAGIVNAAVANERWLAWLAWRPLVGIGRISYGVYIYHGIILVALWRVLPFEFTPWSPLGLALFSAYTAVTVAVAWCSFAYFESWFLRRKGHYDRWMRAPQQSRKRFAR
jgi:peptidoglycan/LPS O-acetylase OafA/YrhL